MGRQRPSRRTGTFRRNANERLTLVLPLLVLIATIPLASNRPMFWMVNALAIGFTGLLYAIFALGRSERPATSVRAVALPALLFAAVTGWILIQTVGGYLHVHGLTEWTGARVPSSALAMLVRYVSYGVIFALALQAFARRSRADLGMTALFGIVVLEALVALFSLIQLGDSLLFLDKWAYAGYATGTFVNRNHLATFLAFGAGLGTALLVAATQEALGGKGPLPVRLARAVAGRPGALAAGLVAILFAVAFTGSRMGLLVTALGIVSSLALALLRSSAGGRLATVSAGVLVVGGFAGWGLLQNQLFDRLGDIEQDGETRMELYRQTADLVLAAPWTGHGAGSFEIVFTTVRQLPINPERTWTEAHNTYLELAAEIGVPATVALQLALLLLVVRCLSGIRSGGSVAPVAALSAASVAAVHSLVDFSLQVEANVLFFALVLAAGVAQASRTDAAPSEFAFENRPSVKLSAPA